MKHFALYLVSLWMPLLLVAQPICQITEFTVEDGLLQDIVSGVIQDRKGFIWMSTRNGLNKFDGYTFKNYKSVSHQEHSLSNNRITFISETIYGDIWCQTYDSRAYIFDTRSELFFDVLAPVEQEIQRKNNVQRIIPLGEGIAWIVCDKGYCYRVDEKRYKEKEGITLYGTFGDVLKGGQVFTVFQDSEKDEWILTDKGVSVVGRKNLESDFPFEFIREHNGKIYLASGSEKLACYNLQTESVRSIEIPYKISRINGLEVLEEDMLALATDQGVILFDSQRDTFRMIDIRTEGQFSKEATLVYQDRIGELWIFSTERGVIRFNPETGEKQHLYTPEEEVVKYDQANRPLIFEDKLNTIWLIPIMGNFCYYDRESKKLKAYYTDINDLRSLFAPLVRYHYQDRQGNCWLAGARGVKKCLFIHPLTI